MESTRTGSTAADEFARPLLVTADVELLDDVLRLSAAAGVELAVVPDVVAARAFWASAPVVLVGDDAARAAAGELARARPRRRDNVVLVGRDGVDDEIWPRALALGADQVFALPAAEPALLDLLADCAEPSAPPASVVAVIGGRGGAGASSLAAALAVTATRAGQRVSFVDADPLSGGADLLFAGETAAGARWPDLAAARGRISAGPLRDALPQVGGLAVLSWDRAEWPAAEGGSGCFGVEPEALASVLDALRRASDLVVVDLPRRLDDATRAILAVADLVLVVTPAEVRAAAATSRVAAAVARLGARARLVVRGPSPGGLRASDVADAVGLPLAGELRPEPDLAAALERGEAPAGRGVGPLAGLCQRLLDELAAYRARSIESAQWLG